MAESVSIENDMCKSIRMKEVLVSFFGKSASFRYGRLTSQQPKRATITKTKSSSRESNHIKINQDNPFARRISCLTGRFSRKPGYLKSLHLSVGEKNLKLNIKEVNIPTLLSTDTTRIQWMPCFW